jgi:hypothetical protein
MPPSAYLNLTTREYQRFQCRSEAVMLRSQGVLGFNFGQTDGLPLLNPSYLTILDHPVMSHPTLRSWLRHYATSRKVVGSSNDEVDFFFSLPNPSSRVMALGSTQSLTEMSTRNLPGGYRAAGA